MSRLRLLAVAVALALPFHGFTVPAHADGPAHGSIRIEIGGDEPSADVSLAPNSQFDAVGTLSGVVNNVKLDPRECQVAVDDPTALVEGRANLSARCAGAQLDLATKVDRESGAAATAMQVTAAETGDGTVAAAAVIVIVCICGPIIVIIIIF